MHACMYVCVHAYSHACVCACRRAGGRACLLAGGRAGVHACLHVCMFRACVARSMQHQPTHHAQPVSSGSVASLCRGERLIEALQVCAGVKDLSKPLAAGALRTMNERTWHNVMMWERLHASECGAPMLLKFQGKPHDLSPLAWVRQMLGGPAPFDRHDWTIDRCGKEVRMAASHGCVRHDAPSNNTHCTSASPSIHDAVVA
eukprot:364731-Chlamydomonas_euryale.AAC.12